MKKKILLAIDSYKGCLSSSAVEKAVAEGIHSVAPDVELCSVPMADGGEGMLEVLVRLTHGHKVRVATHDALMRPMMADYGVLGDGWTAVVEMAQCNGLPLLEAHERNPWLTSTYGTGEIVRRVIDDGYRSIIMGLGGSSTNDGGMGMMQALGAQFYNVQNELLEAAGCGQLLSEIDHFDLRHFLHTIRGVEFVTACDVDSPFCGPQGAAAVFAPQKGADAQMVEKLDQGLAHFAEIITRQGEKSVIGVAGAGAAGGMGGCLYAFFQSALTPGIDLILEAIGFRQLAAGALALVTGEGKSDRQTLLGKVPAGILRVGQEMNIKVALLSGAIEEKDALSAAGFSPVIAVTPLDQPLNFALQPEVAEQNLWKAARELVKEICG